MRRIATAVLQIFVVLFLSFLIQKLLPTSTTPASVQPQSQIVHTASTTNLGTKTSDMSTVDFQLFNRLAVEMNFYHSLLRNTWDELYTGTAPGTLQHSASSLITLGLHFCSHLKGHHDIEETYWFPILGQKMEAFRGSGFAKEQHRAIHKGLDVLGAYLRECRSGSEVLRRERVREILDSFGRVLWVHLDDEVKELGAENMRKYWTREEIEEFPF